MRTKKTINLSLNEKKAANKTRGWAVVRSLLPSMISIISLLTRKSIFSHNEAVPLVSKSSPRARRLLKAARGNHASILHSMKNHSSLPILSCGLTRLKTSSASRSAPIVKSRTLGVLAPQDRGQSLKPTGLQGEASRAPSHLSPSSQRETFLHHPIRMPSSNNN